MDKGELQITAELALLELSGDERERLGGEVTQMLEYFEKMSELDVEDLEPTTHALLLKNRTREDLPGKHEATPEDLLHAAPERDDRFMVIPNVL